MNNLLLSSSVISTPRRSRTDPYARGGTSTVLTNIFYIFIDSLSRSRSETELSALVADSLEFVPYSRSLNLFVFFVSEFSARRLFSFFRGGVSSNGELRFFFSSENEYWMTGKHAAEFHEETVAHTDCVQHSRFLQRDLRIAAGSFLSEGGEVDAPARAKGGSPRC